MQPAGNAAVRLIAWCVTTSPAHTAMMTVLPATWQERLLLILVGVYKMRLWNQTQKDRAKDTEHGDRRGGGNYVPVRLVDGDSR